MTRRIGAGLALPAILCLVLAAVPGWAQKSGGAAPKSHAGTYDVDQAHTSVGFQIRHLVAKVPGRFTAVAGTIDFNPADLGATRARMEIEAASINTDNAKRDEHLRGPDFFDVAKFPKITFVSTSVITTDATRAKMTGNLTIKGITKPVTLEVEVLGVGPGMMGDTRAGFEARGRINRTDFDVTWNRIAEGAGAILGDDVDIVLNVEAVKPLPKEEKKGTAAEKKG